MKSFEKMDKKKRKAMILGAVAFDAAMEGMDDSAKDYLERQKELQQKDEEPTSD